MIEFREYSPADKDACLAIFKSNIPTYFRDHEVLEFDDFLNRNDVPYFVLELDQTIVACGGYWVNPQGGTADLCWGMVHADHHRRKYGEYLLLARLSRIIAHEHATGVRLGTSQLTEQFFHKFGFKTRHNIPNGITEGLDDVEMLLEFDPDNRKSLSERWRELNR